MDFKEPLHFSEFKKVTYEAWKAQALKELKKENLESLQWKNNDNIILAPYYDKSNAVVNESFHHQINPENNYSADSRWWENRQEIKSDHAVNANKLILEALEGGADGVVLKDLTEQTDLNALLKEVKPEYCSISIFVKEKDNFQHFLDYVKNSGLKNFSGEIYWEDVKEALEYLQKEKWEKLPEKIRCFGLLPDKGSDEIVSLLLKTKNLLDRIEDDKKGHIANRMSWYMSLSEDYFQGIAKIKALRNLLYQVFSAYHIDLKLQDLFIYASSPTYTNEKFGPHENMLKATTAAMAGIIGGCNAIYVQPEDSTSTMQRRIARNVSLILKEEAHLSKNIDPAAGSYFLEHLIDQTAKHKWQNFQELV